MSRVKRQMRNTRISHAVKINGEWINIAFARIVYRCAVCHSELKRRDAGLVCIRDDSHRRFIKQADAEKIQRGWRRNQSDLNQFYIIKNGKVELKCQS